MHFVGDGQRLPSRTRKLGVDERKLWTDVLAVVSSWRGFTNRHSRSIDPCNGRLERCRRDSALRIASRYLIARRRMRPFRTGWVAALPQRRVPEPEADQPPPG
jgi:hypothetical protein